MLVICFFVNIFMYWTKRCVINRPGYHKIPTVFPKCSHSVPNGGMIFGHLKFASHSRGHEWMGLTEAVQNSNQSMWLL